MKTVIGSVLALGMIGSASAAVECNTFPSNTIKGSVNDDVLATNYTCTVAASGFVNGSVSQTGPGNLVIRGVVNGEVSETDDGNITIAGGKVGGSVREADRGSLVLRGGGSANGGLEESGPGNVTVTVDIPGVVNAGIIESGAGSVFVTASSGSYEGDISENDGGFVDVTVEAGVSFKGSVEEAGVGDVTVDVSGVFEGNLIERAGGNVLTTGEGTFKGNSEHQLPGTCTNTIADFQGAVCNLL